MFECVTDPRAAAAAKVPSAIQLGRAISAVERASAANDPRWSSSRTGGRVFDKQSRRRALVRRGMTGLGHVSAASDTFGAYRRLGLVYLQNRLLSLDVVTLVATACAVAARWLWCRLRAVGTLWAKIASVATQEMRLLAPTQATRVASPGEDWRLLLVCSSGGHLAQLLQLRGWWGRHERVWVTFDTLDAVTALSDEHVAFAFHPTTRSASNLVRNTWLAARILVADTPDVIISNGAGVALPFFIIGRLLGVLTVYIEVYDRIDSPTLTGRLCHPVSNLFCVQWPEQQRFYRGSVVIGGLL